MSAEDESPDRATAAFIGATLARERTIRGFTIEELAKRASVSTGLLSELMRGIGNPSLRTLVNLAKALNVPLGAFFGPSGDNDFVVHQHTRRRLMLAEPSLTYQLLVPDLAGSLSMLYIELPPRLSTEEHPFSHVGEEAFLVLSGCVEAHIGERVFELKVEDSIRFNSSLSHWYRTGDEEVRIVAAMTPPTL